MAKKKYKTRNWSEYNKALVKRGEMALHLEPSQVDNWFTATVPAKRKKGRPQKYSQVAVDFFFDGKTLLLSTVKASPRSHKPGIAANRHRTKESRLLADLKKSGRQKKEKIDCSQG